MRIVDKRTIQYIQYGAIFIAKIGIKDIPYYLKKNVFIRRSILEICSNKFYQN